MSGSARVNASHALAKSPPCKAFQIATYTAAMSLAGMMPREPRWHSSIMNCPLRPPNSVSAPLADSIVRLILGAVGGASTLTYSTCSISLAILANSGGGMATWESRGASWTMIGMLTASLIEA